MLSLNDIKPLGAFIENTIRPVIKECREILDELNRQGIPITELSLKRLVKNIANLHFKTIVVQAIRDVVIALIVSGVIWTIYQS